MSYARTFSLYLLVPVILAFGVALFLYRSSPETEPVAPGVTPPAPVSLEDGLSWHTYHGDATLAGVADTEVAEPPVLLWRFDAGAPIDNTPVVQGGVILVANKSGELFGIDLAGRKIWSRKLGEERFDAPLACFGGLVLAGSAAGTLYGIDQLTGEERWRADIGGPILGTPNAAPGEHGLNAYVIAQDDGVIHCFELATGRRLWQAAGVDRCDGSPSVDDGVVVFGSCAAALHLFSAVDGGFLMDVPLDDDSQVAGGVALRNGFAYSGSRGGMLVRADVATGEIVWRNRDTEQSVFTTPAVDGESVLFSCDDGGVYALDLETGARRWRFETPGEPTSPVIARDRVVVTANGTLYILQLRDGRELWSRDVSDRISSPAVISGRIIVGCDDGTVAAFGPKEDL